MSSREITIHTVIYGVYIWFWPTLIICEYFVAWRLCVRVCMCVCVCL